jgi:hypothetical protein
MPPPSSHAKEAPSSPLALKELLPEGSCISMAPATGKNAMTMWACSPNGEMKVRALCVCVCVCACVYVGKKKHGGKVERMILHQSAWLSFWAAPLSHGQLAGFVIVCRLWDECAALLPSPSFPLSENLIPNPSFPHPRR